MVSGLEIWARTERQFIKEEFQYLNAGGKVISPSGDDITKMKLEQLSARIEHVETALKDLDRG